ncbi:UNVERIFIED_CONTAM: hypothetical protein Slati_4239500 [Sesamum latifolium]|uniref:Uncharacterized protein n=1 Tax=Sesamum latifolium TaxID=2727402 RepID=A0AAW2TB14_9LAMI
MAEFIGLGALEASFHDLRRVSQTSSVYCHEGLCYEYDQRSVDGILPLKGRLLVSHVNTGFLGGDLLLGFLSFFSATFFLGCLSNLHINVLCSTVQEASNLETGFLTRDLKKSPSKSPCEKVLAFTSCMAEGTSSAAALNLCKYSFEGSLSFGRTTKRLSYVLRNFRLLAN